MQINRMRLLLTMKNEWQAKNHFPLTHALRNVIVNRKNLLSHTPECIVSVIYLFVLHTICQSAEFAKGTVQFLKSHMHNFHISQLNLYTNPNPDHEPNPNP